MPSEKAVVASRADAGSAIVFWRSLVKNASASASLPPAPVTWAQAASMFHFAEPDEAGLGVMISTPGLTRSSQPWMPSGLPSRTTNDTTEDVAMPLVSLSFQSSATRPASTSRCRSGSREKCTTSASSPPSTARLWSPEAPYDVWKVTPSPSEVPSNSSNTGTLAASSTEKPTRLSRSPPVAPPLAPEQAVRASTPVSDAATAALNLAVMSISLLLRTPTREGAYLTIDEQSSGL